MTTVPTRDRLNLSFFPVGQTAPFEPRASPCTWFISFDLNSLFRLSV